MGKNLTSENRKEFIRKPSKIVRAWNGHLEMFSLPQPIENSRQFLFLRFNYLRSSQHGLKKYIKLVYSTSFLCALLLINIPVA